MVSPSWMPLASASAGERSAVSSPRSSFRPTERPGLGPGVIVVESPARAQDEGVILVGDLGGRSPFHGGKPAQTARELSTLVQKAGPRVILMGAGPLEPVALQPMVFDAHEVRSQDRNFVIPDFLSAVRCPFVAHAFGDFPENPPVGFCESRRRTGGPNPVDAALAVGEGAVVLAPRRSREHHVGQTAWFLFQKCPDR